MIDKMIIVIKLDAMIEIISIGSECPAFDLKNIKIENKKMTPTIIKPK